MSVRDSKRYFWLKLKDDFFDDDAIEWLEEQPNGKEYVLFYLKLCLKSLKHDCCLIRTVGNMLIPYDAKKLGELTRTKEDTVIVALELLKRIGLVDLQENGALFMAKVSEMIGSETNAAARMRKTREKAKELGKVNNVRPMLQNCSPELEIEKEIEIDKELDKEIESVPADTPTTPPKKPKKKFVPPTLEEVKAYVAEKNLDVDPQKFFDYYEAGDWHDGNGKAVKSWKQKCLTWDKHDNGRQVTTQPQQVTTEPKDIVDTDIDWSKFDG
jgi:predicted phage replisome organizer